MDFRDPRMFDDRECVSQLWIFNDGKWFIEYRLTLPREHEERIDQ